MGGRGEGNGAVDEASCRPLFPNGMGMGDEVVEAVPGQRMRRCERI